MPSTKRLIALRRYVRLGDFLVNDKRPLGLLDGVKDGTQACLVHVNANGEIDLIGVGISAAGGGKAENRIGGEYGQMVEHKNSLYTLQ